MTIEANADERAALARRFDLIAIDRLSARLSLSRCMARDRSGMVLRASFDLEADLVQRCVVSLEPVEARISEAGLIVEYRLNGDAEPSAEVNVTLEGFDPPDILVDDQIDLGELVAEHLALALDPYPRADSAVSAWTDDAGNDETTAESDHPFAALRGWSRSAKPDQT